jgi:hypothetical protein
MARMISGGFLSHSINNRLTQNTTPRLADFRGIEIRFPRQRHCDQGKTTEHLQFPIGLRHQMKVNPLAVMDLILNWL